MPHPILPSILREEPQQDEQSGADIARAPPKKDIAGVGMRIQDDPPHRVISLVPSGPADRSGFIEPGDILVAVDQRDVSKLSSSKIRTLIAGPNVLVLLEAGWT